MSTPLPGGTPTATIDVSGTPRVPFARLVSVEVRKLADTRAGRWLLGLVVALTTTIMAIFFAVSEPHERFFEAFLGIAATPQGFLLPVLGILLVTSEWGQRTAMVTFALEPSRARVVAAKVVAALLYGIGAFVAAIAVASLCALLGGSEGSFEGVDARTFLTFFGLQLLTVLQGLAYGLLFLSTPAAIVTFFVLPVVSRIVFNLVPVLRDPAPWLDLGTAQAPLFSGVFELTGEQYAQLATATLLWVVLPFVAGLVRVMRTELK